MKGLDPLNGLDFFQQVAEKPSRVLSPAGCSKHIPAGLKLGSSRCKAHYKQGNEGGKRRRCCARLKSKYNHLVSFAHRRCRCGFFQQPVKG